MKQTVNEYTFTEAFRNLRPENFSYEGLKALFDYFEEYEESIGEEVELDVIAICCDFTEYDSLEDFQKDYSEEYQTIEDIEEKTTVIRVNDKKFIIQQF